MNFVCSFPVLNYYQKKDDSEGQVYSISDMQVFIQVVDSNGFSSAGRKLRMTTAVVSKRIIRLEEKFNLRLLHRTTRSVRPTEEGKLFYDSCKRILNEVDNTETVLAQMRAQPSGSLSVSVPIALGHHIIAPQVGHFCSEHEDLNVRFQATDRLVDLIGEDFDLAVRKGDPESSTLIKKNLAPDLRIVCAAPSYFKTHPVPQTPEDLMNHNCLLLRFPGSRRYTWQLKNKEGGNEKFRISGNMDTDNSDILIDWAIQGKGLICKSVWDLWEPLKKGELVGVLKDYWLDDLTVFALMPPRNPQPTKVRYFLDFLADLFKQHPAQRFTNADEIKSLS